MDTKTVAVSSFSIGLSCDMTFKKGERYLVYASYSDGALHASFCSRSTRLENVQDDLVVLGPGEAPVNDGRTPPVASGSGTEGQTVLVVGTVILVAAIILVKRFMPKTWKKRRK